MNQDAPWDHMVQGHDGDFIDFLNSEEFSIDGLDFANFDASAQDGGIGSQAEDGGGTGQFGGNDMIMMGGTWDAQQGGALNAAISHPKAAQMTQQASQQPYGQMNGQMAVPPTPESMEMHARPQFQGMNPQQARMVYDAYSRKQQQEQQMVFTPLVSPAVTPLDTQFVIPEYAVPGEYFSPLTSPAMPAQQVQQRSVYSSTSEGASPSDMEIDSHSPQAVMSAVNASVVSKGKNSNKVQKSASSRTVRQSPAMKPQQQKRKPPTSSSIIPRDVVGIMEGLAEAGSSSRPGSSSLRIPSQRASESASTSPEPLNEVLMPPPATPRSAPVKNSPMLAPQQQYGPVTPATLMRLQQHGFQTNSQPSSPLILPTSQQAGSAPSKPNLQVDTSTEDDLATPTLSALDGGFAALTPRTVPASPSVAPKAASTTSSKGKKRNSSSHPSPALRPRISPSIKPLLPDGCRSSQFPSKRPAHLSLALSADQSALLLASKSNYQNILEGNKVPGVVYPNALSANLTSKRTSHKLAEQGRRNRMNSALQELANLLPASGAETPTNATAGGHTENGQEDAKDAKDSPADGSKDSGAKGGGAAGKEAASKASTVEMAIDFIKALQAELGAIKGQLADAEKRLGETSGDATASSSSASSAHGASNDATQKSAVKEDAA